MSYFVTGATGFIGRHLVERLLEREGDIHVLVREESQEKLEALREGWETAPTASSPSSATSRSRCSGSPRRTARRSRGRALLPPRGDLRHDRRRGAQPPAQRQRHAERDRPRQRARRRPLPPRLLDRGRRRVRRPLHRGLLRRGPEARAPLPQDQVRGREARAPGRQGPVARLPALDRRRQLQDRRDGQDRRALLLLQGDPEGALRAAAVVPARRHRGRQDQHRAPSTTSRRRWTTSPTSPTSTARPSTSSTRR